MYSICLMNRMKRVSEEEMNDEPAFKKKIENGYMNISACDFIKPHVAQIIPNVLKLISTTHVRN